MFSKLLITVGLLLSAVAAFYSVTGLAYVFAGAFWPIILMGGTLEAAKLMGASWVFKHWRTAPRVLVSYLGIAVVSLMLLTGIGIFGYLSRAYTVQQAPLTQILTQQDAADRSVSLAQLQYDRDQQAVSQLAEQPASKVIDRLTENNRLSGQNGAVSVLRSQQALLTTLQQQAQSSARALQQAETERAAIQQQVAVQTTDIGPLMFAAKAWYGTTDTDTLDKTVRTFIFLIMFVFDPMAIALLLAGQWRPDEETSMQALALSMGLPMPPDGQFVWSDSPDKIDVRENQPPSRVYVPSVSDVHVPFQQVPRGPAMQEPMTTITTTEATGVGYHAGPIGVLPQDLKPFDTDDLDTPDEDTQLPAERPSSRRRHRIAPKQ